MQKQYPDDVVSVGVHFQVKQFLQPDGGYN